MAGEEMQEVRKVEERVKYVIYEATDDEGPQCGMCTLEAWNKEPFMRESVSGKPMKIVKEVEAASWNEAMQMFNDHYDYGPYKPMED